MISCSSFIGNIPTYPRIFPRSLIHLCMLSESFHSGTLGYLGTHVPGGPGIVGKVSWKLWKMLRKKIEYQVDGQFDRPDNFEL